MKLLINNKYEDVDFFSFLKCYLLASVGYFVILFFIAIIIGILGNLFL